MSGRAEAAAVSSVASASLGAMSGDELKLVQWLSERWRPDPRVELGIGDDLAMVRCPTGKGAGGKRSGPGVFLIGSDVLLDGIHFDISVHAPEQIGRKAVACNLSDCAAMAVRPLVAVVSVALHRAISFDDACALFRGMFTMADEFGLCIVGGDITTWGHPLVIDVSITATAYEGIRPVRRNGAKVGDELYVTGPLGGSLLGRHFTFRPRVEEARMLAAHLGERLHAMMDISDGLSLDLWRMTQASGVGALLERNLLEEVISEDARRASARDRHPPLEHALTDGEDFELLIAADGVTGDLPVRLYRIGSIVERGLTLERADGNREPLEPGGYVH